MENFPERLYELRKNAGYSQEELADKIGVSRQAVSKWERGEAVPDTDNLIALADIYGVSIDELIRGTSGAKNDTDAYEAPVSDDDGEDDADDGTEVNFTGGININDKDSHVRIDRHGIHVEDGKDTVHIDRHGIFVNEKKYSKPKKKRSKAMTALRTLPIPIAAIFAYVLFGIFGVCGGWAAGWTVLLLIPVYYSLLDAIEKKKPSHFAYPVFVTAIYVWFGITKGLWHPYWVEFLTIPIYYSICHAIEKIIKSKNISIEFDDDDDDDDD